MSKTKVLEFFPEAKCHPDGYGGYDVVDGDTVLASGTTAAKAWAEVVRVLNAEADGAKKEQGESSHDGSRKQDRRTCGDGSGARW